LDGVILRVRGIDIDLSLVVRVWFQKKGALDVSCKLVSIHKWPFCPISASIGAIACAAYPSTPPRISLISLTLGKNSHF
jgi:hypothetical protein